MLTRAHLVMPLWRLSLATLSLVSVARAGDADPLRDGDAVAELGLARIAEEAGDARLASVLSTPSTRQLALVAVRAAVHARAPESLLTPLALLACGRDPALAPEAAQAVFSITTRLSADVLSAREVLKSDLRQARTSLQCADSVTPPRSDIVALLAMSTAALDALLR